MGGRIIEDYGGCMRDGLRGLWDDGTLWMIDEGMRDVDADHG